MVELGRNRRSHSNCAPPRERSIRRISAPLARRAARSFRSSARSRAWRAAVPPVGPRRIVPSTGDRPVSIIADSSCADLCHGFCTYSAPGRTPPSEIWRGRGKTGATCAAGSCRRPDGGGGRQTHAWRSALRSRDASQVWICRQSAAWPPAPRAGRRAAVRRRVGRPTARPTRCQWPDASPARCFTTSPITCLASPNSISVLWRVVEVVFDARQIRGSCCA